MDEPTLTYDGYLQLDTLLGCQAPRSGAHDETLFIIIHQTAELWLKLCLHELDAARASIASDALAPALKMLARACRIQSQLAQSWDVLATMTPADYGRLRPHLGSSSGFQSWQYRMLEFMLGARDRKMVALHADAPQRAGALEAELVRPSLYDEVIRKLARSGLPVPAGALERDIAQAWTADAGVEACWAEVYRDPERWWELYELAEKLTDLEQGVQFWRYGHIKIVERIIGLRRGTGGSTGVAYLNSVLAKGFFPELLSVRTIL